MEGKKYLNNLKSGKERNIGIPDYRTSQVHML